MATSAQNLAHRAKKLAFCITRVNARCAEDIANYLVRKFNSSPPTTNYVQHTHKPLAQVSASATTIDTRSYEHKSKS